MNRLDSVQECCVELAGYGGAPEFRTSGIWAVHPDDRDFRMQKSGRGVAEDGRFCLTLQPLSVTVVRFGK